MLIASAEQLRSEGKLDAALDRYLAALRVSVQMRDHGGQPTRADFCETAVYEHLPFWATEPDQTSGRIGEAIRRLDEVAANLPSRSGAIKSNYLRMRGLISADREAVPAVDMTPHDVFLLYVWSKCFPWERARARRVLDFITARNLEEYHNQESAAAEGKGIAVDCNYVVDRCYPWERTTYLFSRYWLPPEWRVKEFAEMETRRRAVRLLLALEAWKLEHGELPATLDELVGPYLDRLPVDPYCAEPFRYFPEGLPIPVDPSDLQHRARQRVEAGKPFVWSAGLGVVVNPVRTEPLWERSMIAYTYRGDVRQPTSEYDVWQHGWLFPLP